MNPKTVVIVSGLPRSGTSMMMKMIDAAGIPALTDNLRSADEDNPRGYYEYEPVKTTRRCGAATSNRRTSAAREIPIATATPAVAM